MVSILAAFLLVPSTAQKEVYVAPTGSDRNLGTPAKPVASLEAARDRARVLGAKSIVVESGEFRFQHSLALDARDDGLVIRAANGARPRIEGGVEIPASAVEPCTDQSLLSRIVDADARKGVRWVDLKALGINQIAPMQPRGFPQPVRPAPSELFADQSPMTLARWPNDGYATAGQVIEAGNGEGDRDKPMRKPVFLAGDRAKAWASAEEPWLYGYWKYDWADESIRAEHIDAGTGAITLATPHTYGVDKGVPFYAENLIEELDKPGEYWIDRAKGRLYFIPSGPNARLELSTLTEPLLTVSGAKNVTIRGIDLCVSCVNGIEIRKGEKVRIEGCRLFALGGRGAVIEGGHECGLQSSDIWDTGEGGVTLDGGDRNTLQPGRNFVDNCDIHNYERRSQTYRPAVLLSGVGNRVTHCAIHDAPHSAIIFGGNDHQIEFNEFYRTISRTGDGGVVYTGRDWTARGTSISYNHFHDDIGLRKWEPAIYVDDLGSGIVARGNLIERCHWGFLIGGGRDNVLEDNTIVDCSLAFDCDARGLGWGKTMLPTLTERLRSTPYQQEPWRTRYPALVTILDTDPLAPSGNVLRGNVLIRSGRVEQQMEAPFKKTAVIAGNIETAEMALRDKALKKSMGLQPDPLRASLPAPGR